MKNLNSVELESINGGVNGWKVAGGVLVVAGSVGEIIVTGGTGAVPGVVGITGGIAMIGDGLND